MSRTQELAAAFGVKCFVSGEMEEKMMEWVSVYMNNADWTDERIQPLHIPETVVKELKRLTLTEFSISEYTELQEIIVKNLDIGLVTGGLLFKPYYDGSDSIRVDVVAQDRFIPVIGTRNAITGVICMETVQVRDKYYTRAEYHHFDALRQEHTIDQKCFVSSFQAFLGKECSLKSVEQWQEILPHKVYTGVKSPLFSVFRMPDYNNVDRDSPLGLSAFSAAMPFFEKADRQGERIDWEYQSAERAIDATESYFRYDPVTNRPVLPKGRERMYRALEQTGDGGEVFNTFSPEIRDAAMFNGENEIYRRIEFAVGLSYGVLSKIDTVEKTAEEIKASKQRSFAHVSGIQNELRRAIDKTIAAMQYYAQYYMQQSALEYKIKFGDGVLEDVDKEFLRRNAMVQAGYYDPKQVLSWYFDCSLEDAAALMPQQSGYTDLFSGGDG